MTTLRKNGKKVRKMDCNIVTNCYITEFRDGSRRIFFPFKRPNGGGGKKKDLNPSDDKILKSIDRSKRLIRDLGFENDFKYFGTITNGLGIDDREFFDLTRHKLSDYSRRTNPEFKYIIVPDRSGENQNRLHFHGLFKGIPEDQLLKAVNPHTGEDILYKGLNVFNWDKMSGIGFTNFTEVQDIEKAAAYIAGYSVKAFRLLPEYPRKVLHSNNLKYPEQYDAYLDEDYYLSTEFQRKEGVYCSANEFGYFILEKNPN